MKSTPRLLALLLLTAPMVAVAQPSDVTGVAFVDANGNGVRDSGERGLADVVVSDQDTVVATDAFGAYRLRRGTSRIVFVSAPEEYRSVGAFWRQLEGATTRVDFPLAPVERLTEFTFIHASDTHIAPAVLARTQRFREIADSLAPAFVIITGDLVRDALRVGETEARGYYDLFAREVPLFKSPVWTVPGNHEIFGIERSRSNVPTTHPLYGRAMYHHYRGPDYYSFNVGGVHFVGLNTIDVDDQSYYGHVDSLQLRWLERDLAMLPPTMPVVTFNHIPFFSSRESLNGYSDAPPAPTLITVNGKTVFRHTVSNAGEVLAVLRRRRHVLALGGHIHASEQIAYEVNGVITRFNQSAAIVGPSAGAGMQFTSGVTRYTVRNGVIDAGQFIPLTSTPSASAAVTPAPAGGHGVTVALPDGTHRTLAPAVLAALPRVTGQVTFHEKLVRYEGVDLRSRQAVLVDREDGAALPDNLGPYRIVIVGDRRPSRWVRQVVRLEVRDLP